MRLAAVPLVALLLLTGCGGPPSFSVQLDRGGNAVTLTVIDEAGLVTGVSSGAEEIPDAAVSGPIAWHPRGGLTELGVAWMSGVCTQHPTIRLAGNALELTIDEGQGSAESCLAIGIVNAVTLHLNEVVDADAITVRMATH